MERDEKMLSKSVNKLAAINITMAVLNGMFIGYLAGKTIVYGLTEAPSKILGYRNSQQLKWYAPYNNLRDLMEDFRKERKKLGLENTHIWVLFDDEGRAYVSPVKNGNDNSYYLVIGDSRLKNKNVLRHELFHISDEKKKGGRPPISMIEYWLDEWRAQDYCQKCHDEESPNWQFCIEKMPAVK